MKVQLPPMNVAPHLPGHFLVHESDFKRKLGERCHTERTHYQDAHRGEQTPSEVPRIKVPTLSMTDIMPRTPRGLPNTVRSARADLVPLECRPAVREVGLDRRVLSFSVTTKDISSSQRNTLLFYLDDGTMEIAKDSAHGSSPSRRFLHRCRVPHTNGDFFVPESLTVGDTVLIYSHKFTLTGCDTFTRQWYASKGMMQPENVREPDPPRAVSITPCRKTDKLGQYMGNYRNVCRFYATADNLSTPEFERRFFVLYYFLEDDTIKIRENCTSNSGREQVPMFYQRSRMLKDRKEASVFSSRQPQFSDYVQLRDFAVGRVLSLLSMDFTIYDADRWTRTYFSNHLHVALAPAINREVQKKRHQAVAQQSAEDARATSLQLDRGLDVLPVRVGDLDQVLKFKLKHEGDPSRCFSLTYYLCDGSLCIHEIDLVEGVNTGFRKGPFLTKACQMNQLTDAPVQPQDLYPVDSVVKILGRTYRTIEIGYRTQAYFDNNDRIPPLKLDMRRLFQEVERRMRACQATPRELFRQLDRDKKGALCKSKVQQLLQWCHYTNVSESELLMIMRALDADADGLVSYNDFCAAMSRDGGFEVPELDQCESKNYGKLVVSQEAYEEKSHAIRRVLLDVCGMLHSRPSMEKRLLAEFNQMNLDRHGKFSKSVDAQTVHEVLTRVGHPQTLSDVRLLLEHFGTLGEVDYVTLLRLLKASYHDLTLY